MKLVFGGDLPPNGPYGSAKVAFGAGRLGGAVDFEYRPSTGLDTSLEGQVGSYQGQVDIGGERLSGGAKTKLGGEEEARLSGGICISSTW